MLGWAALISVGIVMDAAQLGTSSFARFHAIMLTPMMATPVVLTSTLGILLCDSAAPEGFSFSPGHPGWFLHQLPL